MKVLLRWSTSFCMFAWPITHRYPTQPAVLSHLDYLSVIATVKLGANLRTAQRSVVSWSLRILENARSQRNCPRGQTTTKPWSKIQTWLYASHLQVAFGGHEKRYPWYPSYHVLARWPALTLWHHSCLDVRQWCPRPTTTIVWAWPNILTVKKRGAWWGCKVNHSSPV